MNKPYNPLATLNLARSIEREILAQPLEPLGDLEHARGAGAYAIYYAGDFAPYAALKASMAEERQRPIYVGKAIPKGGRTGGITRDAAKGRPLGERLSIHADSIREAENLRIEDFWARRLVIEDVWIALGENMLIRQFGPLWNVVTAGFGNKAPGKGRLDQAMSLWDTLHPGRVHSRRLGPNKLTTVDIERRVVEYLAGHSVPLDIETDDQDDSADD